MLKRCIWFYAAVLLACRCQFFDNPPSDHDSSETPLIDVGVSLDGPSVDDSYCLITMSGDGVDIGPVECRDCEDIFIEVPEGDERTFRCERFNGDSLLLDTGSVTADVSGEMDPVTITLTAAMDPPEITRQPVDCEAAKGESAVFSVAATGTVLDLRWLNGNDTVSGGTSDSLTIAHAGRSDSGSTWRCIVCNIAGCDTSDAATLTVVPDSGNAIAPDTTPPVITLLGGDTVTIPEGDPDSLLAMYLEQIKVSDEGGGTITVLEPSSDADVGNVRDEPYTITYTATDSAGNSSSATRYVYIIEPDASDTVAPVISIEDSVVEVTLGEEYVDSGVSAEDDIDGDCTGRIITIGTVNTDEAGSYTLTYTVTDRAGNTATASRRVVVREPDDIIPPRIVLKGDDTVKVPADIAFEDFMKTWEEPGFTAADTRDNDLSGDVKVSEITQLDSMSWYLIYSVSDSAGNTANPVKRYFVKEPPAAACIPVITLSGSDSVTLLIPQDGGGARWMEPGFSAGDSIDGDISAGVIVDSSGLVANLSNPGTYKVTYAVTNSSGGSAQKTRIVTVVRNDPYDITPPVITLLGRNSDTVMVNSAASYTDPGATASDNHDGDITARMITGGTVNMARLGTYSIVYIATDSATNRSVVFRKVTVVRDTATNDRFVLYGVPAAVPLPTLSKTYKSVQVDGSGPDLASVQNLKIMWDSADGLLGDFLLTLKAEPYVVTLRPTQTFASAAPEMTITGSKVVGLDGTYYVAVAGQEFFWVRTDGSFAVIWQE